MRVTAKVPHLIAIAGFLLATLLYLTSLAIGPELETEIFSVLLVLAVICVSGWLLPFARDAKRQFDLFHPAFLFLLFFLIYFAFSAWILVFLRGYEGLFVDLGSSPGRLLNTIMVLGILSAFSFGVGLQLSPLSFQRGFFRDRDLRQGLGLLLVLAPSVTFGVLAKIYHLSLYGDVGFDLFRFLSPGRRLEADIQVSQLLLMAEGLAEWGCLIYLFQVFTRVGRGRGEKGYEVAGWLFLVAMLLGAFLVSGKRSVVIAGLVIPLIWRHYLIARIDSLSAIRYLSAGAILITVLLLARIALPLWAEGLSPFDYLGQSAWEVVDFYLNTPEFSTFEMIAGALVKRDELLARVGEPSVLGFLRFTFGTAVFFIPRAIWPDKPVFQDIGHVFFQQFTGNDAQIGLAVTVWGTSLLFFYVPGLVAGFALLGWLANSLYGLVAGPSARAGNVFLYGIIWWLLFQFLRFGTMGFTLLYFFQSMVVGVFVFWMASRIRGA